jgi:hypothetical protein
MSGASRDIHAHPRSKDLECKVISGHNRNYSALPRWDSAVVNFLVFLAWPGWPEDRGADTFTRYISVPGNVYSEGHEYKDDS